MIDPNEVTEHYGTASLVQRVEVALSIAGLTAKSLEWSDLVPLDQFHVRGLGASKELAQALQVNAGCKVVDVGCGLGGPARFLAATYQCHVTGIDLSQPFVDVANLLTDRCGLSNSVTFHQADALDLPFADASFDVAWTQHVAMNIADRNSFYKQIHRVLKPDGKLAIHDILIGDGRRLIFPVPWAQQASMSHLVTADQMQEVVGKSGFINVSWTDTTEPSLTWFTELRSRLASSPPLSLQIVMGPQFLQMAENLSRNLQEGRVRLVQAIYRRV